MLTADVTKISLPELKDNLAKPLLIQMRTPVVGTKLEMRLSVIGDAPLYDLAVTPVKTLISPQGLGVNADLPSDATAVLALVGNTLKAFVIFRCIQFHNSLFNRSTMFCKSK
jgi:hypothetical protein